MINVLWSAESGWIGRAPDLTAREVLVVTVLTPRDQAALHRTLARDGYVGEVVAEIQLGADGQCFDVYRFHHPDGERP